MERVIRIWLILGVVLALSIQLAFELVWVLALVPIALWGVTGVGIAGLMFVKIVRASARRRYVRALAVVLGSLLGFVPLVRAAQVATLQARFQIERGEYERIVAQLGDRATMSEPADRWLTSRGSTYRVEPGPPLRVAFLWPGGVVDNWCAAVFDPTGEVIGAGASESPDPASPSPASPSPTSLSPASPNRQRTFDSLFGGDLLACSELSAPYYFCCFT